MKKIYLLILINLWFIDLNAQTFSWAKCEGLWAYDYGYGIDNDDAGNLYVAGKYEKNAKFSGVTLPCQGNHDAWVARYSPSGALVWIRTMGGVSGDYARGLACDGSYVYVVGEIQGSNALIKFIGSSVTLTCKGLDDIYVAKYDLNGNVIWARRAGDVYDDKGYSVAYDASGNIYICGWFQNKAVFGSHTIYGYGGNDIFVAKLDKDGNYLWARSAGSSARDEAKSIKCDAAGNVYVCGMHHNGAKFGSQTLYTPGSGFNAFFAKYSTDGNLEWVKNLGGNWDDLAWGVTIDNSGKIIITGEFHSSIKFDNIQLNTTGGADVFVAAYNSSGHAVWATRAGGSSDERARGVGTDGNYIYLTGQFAGTAHFGGTTRTAVDNSDVFISCLSNSGQFLWTSTVGGAADAPEDLGYESGNVICARTSGEVYATGSIISGGVFGGTSVRAYSRTDVFITKLRNNLLLRESDLAGETSGPVLDGRTEGRNAILSWVPAPLTDSLHYSLERSYDAVNFQPIVEPALNELNSNYSFIDSVQPENVLKVYYRLVQIDAAGERSYSPTKELTVESACSFNCIVFPNPAQNVLTIELQFSGKNKDQSVLSVIYDMAGKEIRRSQIVAGESVVDIGTLVPGAYFMELSAGNQVVRKKFIKEE